MDPARIDQRELGAGGLTIPRIALGGGNFGGIGSAPELFGRAGLDDDQAARLMDAAWELGISHFDTADAYGGGRSELAIGRWIASRGVRPTLTTKTFNPMQAGADSGLAPERVHRQIAGSLERLGVDHVDLYLAHAPDRIVPISETIDAFAALRAAGSISAYGVSNFSQLQLRAALAVGEPVAIQNGHSLLERGEEDTVLPLCADRGVAYLAFGPLAGGWLTGKYRRGQPYPEGSRMSARPGPYAAFTGERTFDALEALERVATDRGTSMAAVALAWLLADDRVTQVVVGPGRPEHLEPVGEALAHPLTAAERGRVETIFAR